MRPYHLAIRADHTVTRAILQDDLGQTVGRSQIQNATANSSKELLSQLYQECNGGQEGPLHAVVALPGLFTTPLRRAAAETVREALPHGCRLLLCDELEAVVAGALGGAPGLVARSGFDAAIGRISAEGEFTRTEEEFDPLGQEGSALWLGTRTLQVAVRMLEGRLPPSPRLEGMLHQHFGSVTLGQLLHNLETQTPPADVITELGRRTVALSAFPDPEPACRALVVRASRKFSELLALACGEQQQDLRGVLHDSAAQEPFRDEVVRQSQGVRWEDAQGDAMEGCLILARAMSRLSEQEILDESELAPLVWREAMKQACDT